MLLFPSLPVPAPVHDACLLRPFDFGCTGIFNVLQLPATQVPLGLGAREGVPLGVQVVACEGNDPLTIAVAALLEKHGVARYEPPLFEEDPRNV